jgi:glucokinase
VSLRIGLDLGGTRIRAGLVDDRVLQTVREVPTPADGSAADVLQAIYGLLDALPTDRAASIGAGVPSVVDVNTGTVYDVANIPSWTEVPLGRLLRERYQTPTVVQNDANCFALAEYHFGAGQTAADASGARPSPLVGLVVGTGFAGGIVVEGRLLSGHNCGAGEFGTLPYKDSIYEHYCAGLFFEREHGLSGATAYKRAQAGDPDAHALFAALGTHLGRAIQTVLYTVDPACIVMGGSVMQGYALFQEALWAEMETFAFPRSLDALTLTRSTLNHPGLLGAAALGASDRL